MAALSRPQLPPGAGRDFIDALHDLHHRAGWPSLRSIAREVGCSATTVSSLFSSTRLPTWGLLELVVEAMDGDVEMFRELWCAAGEPQQPLGPRPLRLAGRRHELGVLRRHVSGGAGRLLLVTAEAGMGKTRLVSAAHGLADDVFVASGSCLSLSTEVPLLPVAELLQSVFERDHAPGAQGGVRASARRTSRRVIAPLLPELEELIGVAPIPEDDWVRTASVAALRATLTALATQARFAAVIEDLHWADSVTLDLLDYLLASPAGVGIPIVGSFRTADPATSPATLEWLLRTRERPLVDLLELEPLTRDESAEQLRLLGHAVTTDVVDRIHRRAAGHPLFTEQLAAEALDGRDADVALPRRLSQLLGQRLAGVEEDGWRVARALGVADRELTPARSGRCDRSGGGRTDGLPARARRPTAVGRDRRRSRAGCAIHCWPRRSARGWWPARRSRSTAGWPRHSLARRVHRHPRSPSTGAVRTRHVRSSTGGSGRPGPPRSALRSLMRRISGGVSWPCGQKAPSPSDRRS